MGNVQLNNISSDTLRLNVYVACAVTVGYTVRDVVYVWNGMRQVAIADDMKLSQFDLIATPAANQTDLLQSGIRHLQVYF